MYYEQSNAVLPKLPNNATWYLNSEPHPTPLINTRNQLLHGMCEKRYFKKASYLPGDSIIVDGIWKNMIKADFIINHKITTGPLFFYKLIK